MNLGAAAASRPKPPPTALSIAAADLSPQRANTPLFNHEGADLYRAALAHNAPYATPGSHQTPLTPQQAAEFRAWVARYNVPVTPDYDMAGYFLASNGAPHPPGAHFPDTFKTPLDTSFSGQSKYAKPGTPFVWVGNTLVDAHTGKVIFASQGGH